MPGTLFVVATPIGNLEDLSFRALRTLKEVDLIAAEDTRRTSKLLAHYEVRRPIVSLREHNEIRETPRLVQRLAEGASIALVSDAGTPGIADPGARLVRAVHDAGIQVVPIPGPSAVTAALSASGFPADRFVFLGFPPVSGRAREQWLEELAQEARTAVFFEAPHRIRRTLDDCRQLLGERQICVFRELTKIHEEYVFQPKLALKELGEFCLVVEPASRSDMRRNLDPGESKKLASLFGYLTDHLGFNESQALNTSAVAFELSGSAAKKALKKHKYSVKRQIDWSP